MGKPMISAIIPVYNTAQYIIECLESIKNQTYTKYEVIIVNDGSTDDSEKLISQFICENNLDNFRLISKENGGFCSARNEGIKQATGEWITFIDSDDWLENSFFENFAKADEKYHVDFVLVGFGAYEIEFGRFDIWSQYPVEYGTLPSDLKSLSSFDYVWSRMYKKSIIDAHQIRFDERIKFCEDNAFNFDYVSVIHSFACVNDIGYTYRRGHVGAASKKAITPYMRKYIREHMNAFCDKFPENDIVAALKENRSFSHVMWNALLTDVVVDILEKNSLEAKRKMSLPLSLSVVKLFKANNKKDKVLRYLWTKPFFMFKTSVNVFYKNIDRIKKLKWLSRFLTH